MFQRTKLQRSVIRLAIRMGKKLKWFKGSVCTDSLPVDGEIKDRRQAAKDILFDTYYWDGDWWDISKS